MKATFECSHCGGGFFGGTFDTPEKCLEHEKTCDYNPSSKTCCTCKHLDWPRTTKQDWGHYGDDGEWESDMGCHVFNEPKPWRINCEKWEAKKKP